MCFFYCMQESGYETLRSHFLKSPTSINRTTTKENKIQEYKFQIILRLELSWVFDCLLFLFSLSIIAFSLNLFGLKCRL